MPIAVIGGGLTAIDTATESLAYYPVQVEKFLTRYEALVAERGVAACRHDWTAQDREVAAEFIGHAKAIRSERVLAGLNTANRGSSSCLRDWGGATLCYRRRLIDLAEAIP